MNTKRFLSTLFVALFSLSSLIIVYADEGMWTFNNVPRAEIKAFEGMVPKGVNWRTLAVSDREIAAYRTPAARGQDAEALAG